MTTIFRDNPHGHFKAKHDPAKLDRKLHERGQEYKARLEMGVRRRERVAQAQVQSERKVPVTLANVKWMKEVEQ